MLRNGAIVDSSSLPEQSVQAHPVLVSQHTLVQTVQAVNVPAGAVDRALGGRDTSGQDTGSARILETVHYYPLAVSNADVLERAQSLEGIVFLCWKLEQESSLLVVL